MARETVDGGTCGRFRLKWRRRERFGWDVIKLDKTGRAVDKLSYDFDHEPDDADKERALKILCGARSRSEPKRRRTHIRRAPRRYAVRRGKGQSFAAKVAKAVAAIPESSSGAYGPWKVFIAAVYDKMKSRGYRESLAEFKRQLQEEQASGGVKLSRADLVGAMDPAMVRRSEIDDGISVWNFIQR